MERKHITGRIDKTPRATANLLTVRQLAENWQVSPRTIRRLIANGELPIVRIGRAVRIPASPLKCFKAINKDIGVVITCTN